MPEAPGPSAPVHVPLPDLVSVGLLLRAFPEDVVDSVLGELELNEGRRRLLPARLVVYDVMAMGLFPDEPYQQVMRSVSAGAAWAVGATAENGFPSKVALAKARRRLGHQPLRALFERAARTPFGPVVAPGTVGGRVVGTLATRCLGLGDTAANAAAFGRGPGVVHGAGGPRLRIVGLVESGSQAVLDVALGSTSVRVRALAATLGGSLRPGDLIVLDRGCASPRLLAAARSVGADLLWPADPSAVLVPGTLFDDGSYLSTLHAKASAGPVDETALPVRVLDGTVVTPGGEGAPSRLMTSVLDPDDVPGEALRGLSAHGRGLDAVFEALTAHRDGERLVIRSKTPDGVLQEIYGLLCLYHAIRHLVAGRAGAAK